MTQTINLTASGTPLVLEPVWRATPLVITGTITAPSLTTWRMELWRRPQDVHEDDAEPLALGYGTVASGTLTIAFTSAQMEVDLVAGDGAYDDLWLLICGTAADSQGHAVVAGWLRINEGGFAAEATGGAALTFTVTDDVVTFVGQDGNSYNFPVTQLTEVPDGAVAGEGVVIDDVLILTTPDGVSYAVGVTPAP